MTVSQNLADILARIDAARKAAIQPAPATRLVAVSKTVDETGIREALDAGQRLFGENRVQEAIAKFSGLKSDYPGLELLLPRPKEETEAYTFGLGTGFQLTKRLNASVNYIHTLRLSNLPLHDYNQNTYTLSLGYRF
jgi:hypothetical protein